MSYTTHNRHQDAKMVVAIDVCEHTDDHITFEITTDDGATTTEQLPISEKLLMLAKYLSDVIEADGDTVNDLTVTINGQRYTLIYAVQMLLGVFLLDVLIEAGIDITTPTSTNGLAN